MLCLGARCSCCACLVSAQGVTSFFAGSGCAGPYPRDGPRSRRLVYLILCVRQLDGIRGTRRVCTLESALKCFHRRLLTSLGARFLDTLCQGHPPEDFPTVLLLLLDVICYFFYRGNPLSHAVTAISPCASRYRCLYSSRPHSRFFSYPRHLSHETVSGKWSSRGGAVCGQTSRSTREWRHR